MNIAVIGAGYVGLITAAGLAEIGHQVIGVDDDARKIELLNRGGTPFYEPILETWSSETSRRSGSSSILK